MKKVRTCFGLCRRSEIHEKSKLEQNVLYSKKFKPSKAQKNPQETPSLDVLIEQANSSQRENLGSTEVKQREEGKLQPGERDGSVELEERHGSQSSDNLELAHEVAGLHEGNERGSQAHEKQRRENSEGLEELTNSANSAPIDLSGSEEVAQKDLCSQSRNLQQEKRSGSTHLGERNSSRASDNLSPISKGLQAHEKLEKESTDGVKDLKEEESINEEENLGPKMIGISTASEAQGKPERENAKYSVRDSREEEDISREARFSPSAQQQESLHSRRERGGADGVEDVKCNPNVSVEGDRAEDKSLERETLSKWLHDPFSGDQETLVNKNAVRISEKEEHISREELLDVEEENTRFVARLLIEQDIIEEDRLSPGIQWQEPSAISRESGGTVGVQDANPNAKGYVKSTNSADQLLQGEEESKRLHDREDVTSNTVCPGLDCDALKQNSLDYLHPRGETRASQIERNGREEIAFKYPSDDAKQVEENMSRPSVQAFGLLIGREENRECGEAQVLDPSATQREHGDFKQQQKTVVQNKGERLSPSGQQQELLKLTEENRASEDEKVVRNQDVKETIQCQISDGQQQESLKSRKETAPDDCHVKSQIKGMPMENSLSSVEQQMSMQSREEKGGIRGVGGDPNSHRFSECKRVVGQLLQEGEDQQGQAAAEIRLLAKDNASARVTIATMGAIPALVNLLDSINSSTKLFSLLALLNLAIGNNHNKEEIVKAGAVPRFVRLLSDDGTSIQESCVAALFSLSALDKNKPLIGSSGAIKPLLSILKTGTNQAKNDALQALYNLSIAQANVSTLIDASAIQVLVTLLYDTTHAAKVLAILGNLVGIDAGRKAMDTFLTLLIDILRWVEEPKCQERAVYILMVLAHYSHSQRRAMVSAGAVPGLTELALLGSALAQKRSTRLLECLRGDRAKVRPVSAPVSAQMMSKNPGNTKASPEERRFEIQEMNDERAAQETLERNLRRMTRRAKKPAMEFTRAESMNELTATTRLNNYAY